MTINMKRKQLQILMNDFELLSKTALLQLQIVSKLLENKNIESLIEEAQANEIIIDRLELKVREEIVFAIFRFTPKASDLRQIITYQDITTNLERIGDMCLNIIAYIRETDLDARQFAEMKKGIAKMLKYTSQMLQNAIISFSNEDSKLAYEVLKEDDKVDELYHQLKNWLQKEFAGKQVTEDDLRAIVNIETITHNLERIGDSATNIAESTIYMTDGKDIRHADND